ncbi:MAG TPA: glycosyltransferase family 4 protein [Chitinophagaceae bacterium]|nr:glycosyltransferase family 4 protein [Chitinophagaceae bacterium]
MGEHLHIICLDVPYPVNYGGMFDLFYKLGALQNEGIRIHLHCFEYGRGEQPELNKYCEEVHYYRRRTGLRGLSGSLPYIVSSRYNEELLDRLLEDDYPILMEGIHCTGLLNNKLFSNRGLFVRLHNVEYEYYYQLSKLERSPFKKLFYRRESRLLKKYEARIARKAFFMAVSEKDAVLYRRDFHAKAYFLPVFIPWTEVESPTGSGQFCLYHGNLSVAENEAAATWLLQEVFNDLQIPFVIAGKNPSRRLRQLVNKSAQACLVANPGMDEMQDLIKTAHINVLPAFNSAGVKLKLLNALYMGRHCITNRKGVEGIALELSCHLADTAQEMKDCIRAFFQQEFNQEMKEHRSILMDATYGNKESAKHLIGWIW